MFRTLATLSILAAATPAAAGVTLDTTTDSATPATTPTTSSYSDPSDDGFIDLVEIIYSSTPDDICALQGSYWCDSPFDPYAFSPYGAPNQGYYDPYYQQSYVDPFNSWGNSYDPYAYSAYGYVGTNTYGIW